jgi:hypothetical protein
MMSLCVISIYLTNTTAYWGVYNVVTCDLARTSCVGLTTRDAKIWITLYNVYSSILFRQ